MSRIEQGACRDYSGCGGNGDAPKGASEAFRRAVGGQTTTANACPAISQRRRGICSARPLRHAYPELAAHKQQHEQFTRKIQDFSDKARTGKLALTVALSAFLREWLTGHIMQVDRKYATYLQEKAAV